MANYSVLPPEINSLLIFAGAGAAPMLAAATAWNGLAEELGTAASSFGAVTSGLTGQAWQGAAAAAMTAAAAPYAAWLSAAAAQAAGAAGQAQAVAGAFEATLAAMVQPVMVEANRNSFVQLVLSNFFGMNAPAIAQIEGFYEEMWAQDVTAMAGYHAGASAAATALPSWQQALPALAGLAGLAGLSSAGGGGTSSGAGSSGGDPAANQGSVNTSSGPSGSGNFGFPTSRGYIDNSAVSNASLDGGQTANPEAGLGTAGSVSRTPATLGGPNTGAASLIRTAGMAAMMMSSAGTSTSTSTSTSTASVPSPPAPVTQAATVTATAIPAPEAPATPAAATPLTTTSAAAAPSAAISTPKTAAAEEPATETRIRAEIFEPPQNAVPEPRVRAAG